MDCSPPGSSVHGILQARILEWVVIPFSRASFRDRTQDSHTAGSHQGNLLIYPAPPGWSHLITNKSLTSLVLTSGEIKNSSGWLSLLAWPKSYLTCIRPKPSHFGLHITCQIFILHVRSRVSLAEASVVFQDMCSCHRKKTVRQTGSESRWKGREKNSLILRLDQTFSQ